MRPLVITCLRALLVVLVLGALAAQTTVLVVVATQGVPTIAVAYAVVGVAAVACAEVALVAIWVLLDRVRRDVIFDESAFRWVDVIAGGGLAAALLMGALCVHAGQVDDAPGLGGIGIGIGLAGVAFVLLMVVMKGLLATATRLRHEIDEVV